MASSVPWPYLNYQHGARRRGETRGQVKGLRRRSSTYTAFDSDADPLALDCARGHGKIARRGTIGERRLARGTKWADGHHHTHADKQGFFGFWPPVAADNTKSVSRVGIANFSNTASAHSFYCAEACKICANSYLDMLGSHGCLPSATLLMTTTQLIVRAAPGNGFRC